MSGIERLAAGQLQAPASCLAWNLYGAGLEHVGRDGQPETVPVGRPAPDQLLVRVDAVGLCYSDVKLIKQGGAHPKLYGRDLAVEPTRLGHEATVTVVEVGEDLRGTYRPGERLAIQPDIYVGGRSTAYGYTIPGGLIQYQLLGPEVLVADDGAYVIPVDDSLGYVAAALSEPWACVEGAYAQRRRLEPLAGGRVWILGGDERGAESDWDFGDVLAGAREVLVTNLSARTLARVRSATAGAPVLAVVERPADASVDDVILLGVTSASVVADAARAIAFRGTMNLVGTRPLDGPVEVDAGRIHYHYTAYVGTTGPAVAAAYGEARNRAELRHGGVALFVGAGGPMGQMHMQRALELDAGPATLIGVDVDAVRLEAARKKLAPLAEAKGRTLVLAVPGPGAAGYAQALLDATGRPVADDVIVTVPIASVMAESAAALADDGLLILFAGVPNGTMVPFDLSKVFRGNAQFTGTSGSRIADQVAVLDKARAGALSPERSLGAIGGLDAVPDGLQALIEGRFPGKIVILPQVEHLPLSGLPELAASAPAAAALLDEHGSWTLAAEAALLDEARRSPA
jgi:L-sorbose 1-phosphate reductase